MSSIILYLPVLFILIYAAYNDLKTRTVSNKLILCAAAVLLIQIVHNQLTATHLIFITALLLIFKFVPGLGGADVKILMPLSLSLSEGLLLMFLYVLIILLLIRYILGYGKQQPLFLPMALSYSFLIFIVYFSDP